MSHTKHPRKRQPKNWCISQQTPLGRRVYVMGQLTKIRAQTIAAGWNKELIDSRFPYHAHIDDRR